MTYIGLRLIIVPLDLNLNLGGPNLEVTREIATIMKRLTLALVLLVFGAYLSAVANVPNAGPIELDPKPEQRWATGLITHIIGNYHYRKTSLNDELSAAILDRYLETLDPNRSYFLEKDIESFEKWRTELDDALRGADLEPAFRIFNIFRDRLDDRVNYALGLLKQDFDYTIDESFQVDRSEMSWSSSPEEMNDLWRRRVKNDLLNLKLAGKEEDEARETLHKRYKSLRRRTIQLNEGDVFQSFMNAYAHSVEPHTAYFSPRVSENFEISMSLSLEGIGAVLRMDAEHTLVQRIVAGGPADQSELLHPGDRITGVGQGKDEEIVNVVGWRLDDVVSLIRGPKDSLVRLEILPKSTGPEGPTKVIHLVRGKIELEEQAAAVSIIDTPAGLAVGVIEIPTFYMDFEGRARGDLAYRSTTRDVRRLLGELLDKGVKGIVIDLRGNGGGSLTEATNLTGLFIESGPIVQVRDSQGEIEVKRDPDPSIAYEGPLAVLVDRHSASASEIFAGAIQDYGRGLVIGEPTYGKGTVQSLVDLDRYAQHEDAPIGQLKLTVAQFFRIAGGSTQHRGVVPDIVFPTVQDSEDLGGERSLENALPWAMVRPAQYQARREVDSDGVAEARRRHERRVADNPLFALLLEETAAFREIEDSTVVSLLESKRRQEWRVKEEKRKNREKRYREARGLPAEEPDLDAAEDEATEELFEEVTSNGENRSEPKDVLLEEAANILADYIVLRSDPPVLVNAGEKSVGMTVH